MTAKIREKSYCLNDRVTFIVSGYIPRVWLEEVMREESTGDSTVVAIKRETPDSIPEAELAVSANNSALTLEWIRKTIARADVKIWEWHEGNHYLTIGGTPSQILHLDPAKKSLAGPAFFPAPLGNDLKMLVSQLNSALESEHPFQMDLRLPTITNEVIWLSCRGGRITDESGPVAVVGTLVDITPRKFTEEELRLHKESLEDQVREQTAQLKRSEEQFRSVVEGTPDFIFMVDENFCITYENHAGSLSTNPDSVDNSFLDRLPIAHRERARIAIQQTFRSGDRAVFEIDFARHNKLFHFLCRTSAVLQDGARVSVAILATDITRQKEDARQILALNQDLERRVKNRTHELQRLLRAASLLSSKLSKIPVLQRLVRIADELIDTCEAVFAFSVDIDEHLLKVAACRSNHCDSVPDLSQNLSPRLVRQLKRLTGLHHESKFSASDWGLSDQGLHIDGREVLITPFRLQGRLVGLLVVVNGRDTPSFSESDHGLLGGILSQALVALENEQLLDRTREISVRLLNAQDSERRRIAQELHDEVGGLLTSIQLSLSLIPADDLSTRSAVKESYRLIQKLSEEVRSLSLSLRSSTLDDFGLKLALEEHLNRFRQTSGIDIESKISIPDDVNLAGEIETATFRIVQECLTNIARHSGADSASVAVNVETDIIMIQVSDSGSGFDVSSHVGDVDHMGLSGVIERAELLHGFTDIKSSPGAGARIRVRIPLHRLKTGARTE